MIPIDDDIPIPGPCEANGGHRDGAGRKSKYPFANLQVGQSFATPIRPDSTFWQKQTGFRFTVRRMAENGKTFFRVWRTE
jgi:hypothetical protein